MKKITFLLVCILLVVVLPSAGAQDQFGPSVIQFQSDLESITVAEAEGASETATLSWKTVNMTEGYLIQLFAYEISTWVPVLDEEDDPLEANGSYEVIVRHPLNFNPPTYRLVIMDSEETQVFSEAVLSIPYDTSLNAFDPSIAEFSVEESSIQADALAYEGATVEVSWKVTDRSPSSNLVFEQVLPEGDAVTIEQPRPNLWVSSEGTGAVQPVYPDDGDVVAIRLRLVDLTTGDTLDEAGQAISIAGTRSTPTPAPTARPRPTDDPNAEPPQEQEQEQEQVAQAPVASAGTSGGFELGGHVASFARTDILNAAGMTWVKKQIRWRRGEGTGAAAGVISAAHGSGYKVLLGIVGHPSEMGDFNAYSDEFAAYLGQVAAIGPDAIEVWNEPNLDREWPAGTISGANYTALLAKAFNAIKAANGNVMVISAALAPTGFFGGCAAAGCDDNVFLRQMASAGATRYMDCIGAHYNEGIIPPDQNSGDPRSNHYSRYFNAMLNLYYNTFGGARKVCWTELGYLSPEGYPPLPERFAWAGDTSVAEHAEWLGRAAQLSRSSGRVRLLIVWNVDFTVYDADPQAGYAILRPDGSCPACAALSAAVR